MLEIFQHIFLQTTREAYPFGYSGRYQSHRKEPLLKRFWSLGKNIGMNYFDSEATLMKYHGF